MRKYSRIVVYVLMILVFNIIFFLVGGTDRTTSTWIAYAFTHIAFIVSYVAPLYCKNYKRIPENLITIYVFAWLYSIIAIILNAFIILLELKGIKLCIILNVVLLVIYILQLILNLNVNYTVEKNLETIDAERQFVRDVSAKLNMCMRTVSDHEVRKNLEKAYDAVRTSPLHSNANCMDYEVEIIRLASLLEQKVDAEAYDEAVKIAGDIVKNTKKRNALI